MTLTEQILTIGAVMLATVLTRFLPFLLFSGKRETPAYIRYLGRILPGAVFGMLVVYCLKNVNPLSGSHGLPEAIALLFVFLLHKWKHQTLLSIAGGTVLYMVLVQFVF